MPVLSYLQLGLFNFVDCRLQGTSGVGFMCAYSRLAWVVWSVSLGLSAFDTYEFVWANLAKSLNQPCLVLGPTLRSPWANPAWCLGQPSPVLGP